MLLKIINTVEISPSEMFNNENQNHTWLSRLEGRWEIWWEHSKEWGYCLCFKGKLNHRKLKYKYINFMYYDDDGIFNFKRSFFSISFLLSLCCP